MIYPSYALQSTQTISEKQVSEMRNWRAMYGQSVPQKNSAKHDNKGQSRNSAHKFVCS